VNSVSKSRSLLAAASVGALLVLAWQPGQGRAQAASEVDAVLEVPNGNVYLLKGGAGGFFSSGLSKLDAKLNLAGVSSSVIPLGEWRDVTADIVAQHANGHTVSPMVIVGHSWGANAALLMAAELGKHDVSVDLVVTFDPLETIQVGSNVDRVINFYIKVTGKPVPARGDFVGILENINVADFIKGAWHTNIDNNEELHAQTIDAILGEFER
jgi:pimeloyl-ACP methyl ester carboxylesterase